MMRLDQHKIITNPDAKRRGVNWCLENGVNPDSVPLDALVEILDDQHLEIEIYDRTAQGLPQWDEQLQRPKLRWLHVKTSRPFPEDLLIEE